MTRPELVRRARNIKPSIIRLFLRVGEYPEANTIALCPGLEPFIVDGIGQVPGLSRPAVSKPVAPAEV